MNHTRPYQKFFKGGEITQNTFAQLLNEVVQRVHSRRSGSLVDGELAILLSELVERGMFDEDAKKFTFLFTLTAKERDDLKTILDNLPDDPEALDIDPNVETSDKNDEVERTRRQIFELLDSKMTPEDRARAGTHAQVKERLDRKNFNSRGAEELWLDIEARMASGEGPSHLKMDDGNEDDENGDGLH